MAASTREVRRRVKAVKNIRQITRAMELVAAAKMQRAQTAVQQSRRYAELAWEMLRNVSARVAAAQHPLLVARERRRLLVVLLTSSRGLAGGFNTKVSEAARAYIARQRAEHPALVVEAVSLGRKGGEYLHKQGIPLKADFVLNERESTAKEVLPLSNMVMEAYRAGDYDAVAVVYTDFVSMLRQEPRVRELLPLTTADTSLGYLEASDDDGIISPAQDDHLFEPSPETVLETLVPRLLEMQLYQAVVESRASEHAARMMAMHNATDSAGDLIDDLTLTYNQLRQSGITQELAEISAGRLALGV